MAKYNPDVMRSMAASAMPIAFLAMHEEKTQENTDIQEVNYLVPGSRYANCHTPSSIPITLVASLLLIGTASIFNKKYTRLQLAKEERGNIYDVKSPN